MKGQEKTYWLELRSGIGVVDGLKGEGLVASVPWKCGFARLSRYCSREGEDSECVLHSVGVGVCEVGCQVILSIMRYVLVLLLLLLLLMLMLITCVSE